jgi:hypothetical protein
MSECSLWLKSDANTTTALLTGLPVGATDDDVRSAVASAAGSEALVTGIVLARPSSGGPCLGQALVKLADEETLERVCQAEFQVRAGGLGCVRCGLGWPLARWLGVGLRPTPGGGGTR